MFSKDYLVRIQGTVSNDVYSAYGRIREIRGNRILVESFMSFNDVKATSVRMFDAETGFSVMKHGVDKSLHIMSTLLPVSFYENGEGKPERCLTVPLSPVL